MHMDMHMHMHMHTHMHMHMHIHMHTHMHMHMHMHNTRPTRPLAPKPPAQLSPSSARISLSHCTPHEHAHAGSRLQSRQRLS